MSFLDRFTSQKGQQEKKAPKTSVVQADKKAKAAEKKAFEAVGSTEAPKEAKKEKATTPVVASESKGNTQQAFRVLLRPIVTEKSTQLARLRQYVFEITENASKMDIRNAVHHVYGVRPVAINIVNLPGKIVRYGRSWGRQMERRKAIVTLPEGKSIDVVNS